MSLLSSKEKAKIRNDLYKNLRTFFDKEGFLEVETPILTTIPGMEPHLNPFETSFNTNFEKVNAYLNTSPELQMKKLLAEDLDKIFNITKVFRNGEVGGGRHNPEFTMLEWYRKNADYKDIMDDCENMISPLSSQENFQKPWKRVSVNELFISHLEIDLLQNQDYETFKNTAIDKNLDINACEDWDEIFFKIFLNHIEPHLGFDKATIVYDYPASQAALAKKKNAEPFWAERFELYINGIELANAFSELIDASEQRERLKEEQELRRKLGKTVFDIDEDFLNKLESIRTPSAGIALGLDRLLMCIHEKKHIEDVLLFPFINMLKP